MNIVKWMGRKVEVSHVYRRHSRCEKLETGEEVIYRLWEEVPITPRVGWVMGNRVLHNGRYVAGVYSNYDDCDPACLTNITPVKVILVVFWPTMRPVLVPLRVLDSERQDGIPHPPGYVCSKEGREWMRDVMKEVKRDSKGRWLKG